jgi:hypothetical protein
MIFFSRIRVHNTRTYGIYFEWLPHPVREKPKTSPEVAAVPPPTPLPPLPPSVLGKISSYLNDADRRASKSFFAAAAGPLPAVRWPLPAVRWPLPAVRWPLEQQVALVLVSACALLVAHCLTSPRFPN